MDNNTTFKLSASLKGHEEDVRAVLAPNSDLVISASRDGTVRLWHRDSSTNTYTEVVNSQASAFINSLAWIAPSADHSKGLVVSGGSETIIEAREPTGLNKRDPDYLMIGHSHNVCALDAYSGLIASGSWDCKARVWRNWQALHVLEGHEAAVWAVLILDEHEVLTGSADKTIRQWRDGKQVKQIGTHTDCVRGLCRLPNGIFASCGNDAVISVWTRDGQKLQELHGHTSFIYSIAALPTGEIVSSGEDRTLRVWRGGSCIQTITHPAISVWCVAVCADTGDIISGSSDRMVRVFSRNSQKWASVEAQKEFDDSVAASAIPSNQIGDVNKEKLPGLEVLQRPGKKDGQVIMARNGENVEAYSWSTATSSWTNIGTVVDAVGSSRKQIYDGKEYDYVFDVDIQEGAPPLKLPYNVNQNPYEAATKFLQNNEISMDYLDTVANFIVKNSSGTTIGQQQSGGLDPYGTESRYRPGNTPPQSPSQPTPLSSAKLIPQGNYLQITQANIQLIKKKFGELNDNLLKQGRKDISLNPNEMISLIDLSDVIETASKGNKKSVPADSVTPGIEVVMRIITIWDPADRLPAMDLLRLTAAYSPVVATFEPYEGTNLLDILEVSGIFDGSQLNNTMLATRAFVNMFETEAGRQFVKQHFTRIFDMVKGVAQGSTNKNLKVATVTLVLNYATLFYKLPASADQRTRITTLLSYLVPLLKTESDPETVFRALVALGTLLHQVSGHQARDIVGVSSAVNEARSKIREPRVEGVVREILKLI